ncbi:MAG TPA: SEC-C metal-binding domain-containing protein [Vicinamibacteria bacterium]|nr:SEC-C metal-binding domain-containing protein [Vicinamibacteria bacterium]
MAIKKITAALARLLAGRAVTPVGRNEPCPCGSGRKYKRCCLEKDAAHLSTERSAAQAAKSGYIGGRATSANRALEAANRYRKPTTR